MLTKEEYESQLGAEIELMLLRKYIHQIAEKLPEQSLPVLISVLQSCYNETKDLTRMKELKKKGVIMNETP